MPYKPFDLTGKVALITGGNSGIGLGMADALAQAGADVVIWGTNPGKNDNAGSQLQAHGRRVLTQRVDVGEESQVIDAFGEAVAQMGRIDAVFANAGVASERTESFATMTYDEWQRVLRINLDGAFFTLREAVRHMTNREGGGSLVGMASLAATEGQARGQHYGASKGGLVSMIRACATEFARYGIRANAILPGWIDTALAAPALNSRGFQTKVLPRVPMRRWGRPEDFGGVAVYLTSDASAYHTGDLIVIDGAYGIF